MSSLEAITADVRFVAETGQASHEVEQLRRDVLAAYSSIDTGSLKAQAASDKLDRALGRAGNNASRQRAAILSYRREIAALTPAHETAAVSASRLDSEVNRLGRGALVGTGLLRGLGRAAAFASVSFIGGAGFVYAIRASIKAGAEQTQILANLRNAVEASGNSWSGYRDRITQATEATKQASAFDDDELYKSLQLLIRGTGDVDQALKLNALAADVARGRNMGLVQAAQLLIRVHAGQVGSLRRLGIAVDKGISGTKALEEVQRQYAGAAQSYMKTAAGAQEGLSVAIQDTEKLIGRALLPTVTEYERRLTRWLDDTQNQKRIQQDANRALSDAEQIIQGLADAEKLLAPPIQGAVHALGGLENAVKTALVLGLALKAKQAASSLGLITGASAKARTQIVADAAAEETALAAVGTQAERTSALVSRIGAYTGAGGIPAGTTTAQAGTAGLIRRYGAKVGGPLALAALLGLTIETGGQGSVGSNVAGASSYAIGGYVVGGPLGAALGAGGYEIAQGGKGLSDWLGKQGWAQAIGLGNHTPSLAELAQAAAAGALSMSDLDKFKSTFGLDENAYQALKQIITAVTVYTVTPTGATGLNLPSTGGDGKLPNYTSAKQDRAAALLLNPNNLGLLREQLGYDQRAIAFLQKRKAEGKTGGQKYLDMLTGLTSDRDQIQGRIDQILTAQAAKAAEAKRRADAAAKKAAKLAEDKRRAEIRAIVAPTVGLTGTGPATQAFLQAALKYVLPDKVGGSALVPGLIDHRIVEQDLENNLALAQLHETQAGGNAGKTAKAIREEIAAYQAILKQQEKEAKTLGGLALEQKKGDEIATQQSIAALRNQLKTASPAATAAKNEAEFLSSAQKIIRSYDPNFSEVTGLLKQTNSHLFNVAHETRAQTKAVTDASDRAKFSGTWSNLAWVDGAYA